MPGLDEILSVVEAIYAAGIDDDLWPRALGSVTEIIGGAATTLEVWDRQKNYFEFRAFRVPPAQELKYLEQYAPMNPRLTAIARGKPGDTVSDLMILDERAMSRHPFYMEFLASLGYRHSLCGFLETRGTEGTFISVQRTVRQGPVGARETRLMKFLIPHLRQAFDMTRRLKVSADSSRSFESALDWIPDGVALLSGNGSVLYANEAFQAVARRKDGIAVKKGRVELTSFEARDRLDRAIAQAIGIRDSKTAPVLDSDFPVARDAGAPPYFVSLRPLPPGERNQVGGQRPVAILFVRDPTQRNAASVRALRETFGFTEAEALLAQAIQAGVTLGEYARERAVSLNTVYTHLRRIKEKTGCNRMPQLVARFNEMKAPARLG